MKKEADGLCEKEEHLAISVFVALSLVSTCVVPSHLLPAGFWFGSSRGEKIRLMTPPQETVVAVSVKLVKKYLGVLRLSFVNYLSLAPTLLCHRPLFSMPLSVFGEVGDGEVRVSYAK